MKASFRQRLRQQVLTELRKAGLRIREAPKSGDDGLTKEDIRQLHLSQKMERLKGCKELLAKKDTFLRSFAEGDMIDPSRIQPRLIQVHSDTYESDLFRFASFLWSVPVSSGYGRRLRFLVWDDFADKLMGVIALGDPVFNLHARENWVGWKLKQKTENLCHVLDAYVLGGVPPYSNILGGKLVASLVASNEVRAVFNEKYSNSIGIISGKKKKPVLVLVTTTSALGRSSLYNRLRFHDEALFLRLGETQGWGHFHLSNKVFARVRSYLKMGHHPYADGHKFGEGPNWRLRTLRVAFNLLDIPQKVLRHGIHREVYAVPLAHNTLEFLRGENDRPRMKNMSLRQLSSHCIWRWMIPRAQRDPRYKLVTHDMIFRWITNQSTPSEDLPPWVEPEAIPSSLAASRETVLT